MVKYSEGAATESGEKAADDHGGDATGELSVMLSGLEWGTARVRRRESEAWSRKVPIWATR